MKLPGVYVVKCRDTHYAVERGARGTVWTKHQRLAHRFGRARDAWRFIIAHTHESQNHYRVVRLAGRGCSCC